MGCISELSSASGIMNFSYTLQDEQTAGIIEERTTFADRGLHLLYDLGKSPRTPVPSRLLAYQTKEITPPKKRED